MVNQGYSFPSTTAANSKNVSRNNSDDLDHIYNNRSVKSSQNIKSLFNRRDSSLPGGRRLMSGISADLKFEQPNSRSSSGTSSDVSGGGAPYTGYSQS